MNQNDSRAEILRRIRAALADAPDDPPITRDYTDTHEQRTAQQRTDLLAEHLQDYRAHVHRCTTADLPHTIAELLTAHGTRTAIAPRGLPETWLQNTTDTDITLGGDNLTTHQLDGIDTVITACALAIAETGTIILDAGPDQGRRRITLVPDHHICVVHVPEQVVDSVPQALPRLDPTRPLTWISGPSATSDIELDRVEGVHGPRTLDVILVTTDED